MSILKKTYSIFVLLIIAFCMNADHGTAEQYNIRVAIIKDVDTIALSGKGDYRITNLKTKQEIINGRRFRETVIEPTPNGFKIGDEQVFANDLRVNADRYVTIHGKKENKRFRGNIDILREKGNKLLVVNTLGLEDYVRGVLYHEVPHYWPMNSIKAQAIATRTYALYRIKERAGQKYDVTSDIYSQVYGGRSAERYRPSLATKRTRGMILTYGDEVLPAYFHSACGGKTEHILELWKQDLPPLYGTVCGFCDKSPHKSWKKNFRSKDIQDKLNENGYKIGLIKTIEVTEKTRGGRVKTLRITARDGGVITIPGTKFRDIIGPNELKSNQYKVEMKGYYFDLIGSGWGHGVGMCQWGAYYMAKKKWKYTSILEHYYPGAKLQDIAEL